MQPSHIGGQSHDINSNQQESPHNQQPLLNQDSDYSDSYHNHDIHNVPYNNHNQSLDPSNESDSQLNGLFSAAEEKYEQLKQKLRQHVLYFIVNFLILFTFMGLFIAVIVLRKNIIEKDGKVCLQICYPLGMTDTTIIITAFTVFLLKFIVSVAGILAYWRRSINIIMCMKYFYLIEIVPAFVYLDILELILNGYLFWEAAQLEQIFFELKEIEVFMDLQGIEYEQDA